MKNRFLVIAAFAALVSSLASCGDNKSGGDQSGKDSTSRKVEVVGTGECDCKVQAYIIGDSAKLMVYKDVDGAAVKALPDSKDKAFETGIYVKLKSSKMGWVQIETVQGTTDDSYKDTWLKGQNVGVDTRNYNGQPIDLYAGPGKKYEIVAKLEGEQQVPVLGCCDNWILVKGKGSKGTTVTGWLEPEMQCANAVTNCP